MGEAPGAAGLRADKPPGTWDPKWDPEYQPDLEELLDADGEDSDDSDPEL